MIWPEVSRSLYSNVLLFVIILQQFALLFYDFFTLYQLEFQSMMTFQDLPSNMLLRQQYSLKHTRQLVARVLFEHIAGNSRQQRLISQRDIAQLAGLDWEAVHTSLKSLMDKGAIKIERNRLLVNKESLLEILNSQVTK